MNEYENNVRSICSMMNINDNNCCLSGYSHILLSRSPLLELHLQRRTAFLYASSLSQPKLYSLRMRVHLYLVFIRGEKAIKNDTKMNICCSLTR